MKTNAAGIDLIKSFEGCKLTSYLCPAGVWTIGYGATGPDVVKGLTWTQEQADARLAADLEHFERGVTALVKRPLTENQFSALVCFAYNNGLGNLKSSTLLRCVNAGAMDQATLEFSRWVFANKTKILGLVRRRVAEADLFKKE